MWGDNDTGGCDRDGRIDLTAIAENRKNRTYVFEFKVLDGDAGDGSALQQINDRHYSDKYCDGREVYKVGIEFSRQQRNIVGLDWERVE